MKYQVRAVYERIVEAESQEEAERTAYENFNIFYDNVLQDKDELLEIEQIDS